MKTLTLSQNKTFTIDDEDYEKVSQYNWHCRRNRKNYYVVTHVYKNNIRTTMQLHRFLLNVIDSKLQIDHIDGNGLNNCKANLRIADARQNGWNKGRQKSNTSGYRGVNFHKIMNKWVARITKYGKRIPLGYFNSPEEASQVYEAAARELHKEFYKEQK